MVGCKTRPRKETVFPFLRDKAVCFAQTLNIILQLIRMLFLGHTLVALCEEIL